MPDPPSLAPSPDRIRVCFVVSYFHPHASGAERQALAQGIELARRGHQVHVLTHSVPVEPRDENVKGVHVHRWIRSVHFGPLFALSFVSSALGSLRKLRKQFDVVHTHQGMWEAVATGLAVRWLGGRPTLVQPASSGAFGEADQLRRTKGFGRLRGLILRNGAFAAISAGIEREWLDLGVPRARMVRMASGVDAGHFHPGPSAIRASLPEGPLVLFTGRLHPQKNLDVLFKAWPGVVRATRATLVLVGHGPERRRLETLAQSLDIGNYVLFCGAVSDPADYLRAADAFVLPSVAEGMSNSLLEAMATRLPCLVSRIGGNTDLIDDGSSGLLADPGQPEEWTERVVRVLDEREFAIRLGAEARRRIEETFDIRVVVDRYLKLYRRLIAGEPVVDVSLRLGRWS